MIFLETSQLQLRNWVWNDLEALTEYRNDERCARYQRWDDVTREQLQAMMEREMLDTFLGAGTKHLAIASKDTNELIGDLKVFLNDPTITLGYTISWKHHRKGYAYEMLSTVIEALHAEYPQREIICLVEPENIASVALLKKLGFLDLGYAEKISSQVYGLWPVDEE